MPRQNTPATFGSVTRSFHWLTALLILTAIPLGIIANDMSYDTSAALAQKAQLFSLHKTVGIAAFATATLRILWALTQTHPAPLHPEKRAETMLATLIHWVLYISMLAVPLSGWVHHAATAGFAPILWPPGMGLGQDLPLVPKSASLAALAGSLHWVFTKLLIASILLHIAGALKHHIIDKDATLRRMISGAQAPANAAAAKFHALPFVAALVIYAVGAGVAVTLTQPETPPTPTQTTSLPQISTPPTLAGQPQTGGNWQVQSGSLALTVRQLGSDVTGQFAIWQADIHFDENAPSDAKGTVNVTIDMTSLSLGSVSAQAKGPDFLNTDTHKRATFTAVISGDSANTAPNYAATGTLSMVGTDLPITLPFTLHIDGDTATMQGKTTLDRRDFGIGTKYSDEGSIGFGTEITVALTATRIQ